MLDREGGFTSAFGFDLALQRVGRLAPVDVRVTSSGGPLRELRRERAARRTLTRSRWWYPLVLLLCVFGACYGVLRFDQRIAAVVVWPQEGARFVQVGQSAVDLGYRRTLVVVAGGLNRKNGTLVAEALEPALGDDDTRTFSLVYGNGIVSDDINAKFDALFDQYKPQNLVLVGSSMGGDVVLDIAAHFAENQADPRRYTSALLAPTLRAIYLDCSPLGTADVRVAARTQADLLTGLTEKLGTDGGAGVRLATEMLATQQQWATGDWPFVTLKPGDFAYKWNEVVRDKLTGSGVSTALVKDQYGVIRRFDADRVFAALPARTPVAYLRPVDGSADLTIDVDRVEDRLRVLAAADDIDLTVIDVPGGSHASAVRDATLYIPLLADYRDSLPAEGLLLPLR